MNRYRWLSIILILIGACSYGLLSPFIKIAYDSGFTERQITPAQVTVGTAIMWLLALAVPSARQNPFRGPWGKLSIIGIIGLAGTTILYNAALSRLHASFAIVLLFQFTWITILMECISRKSRPTLNQIAAIAAVLSGTVLAVNILGTDLGRWNGTGVVLGLLSAFTYSLFLFLTGKVETNQHPIMKSAVMLTAGLLAIYAVYPPTFVTEPGYKELLGWGLLLGMLGQVVPTICFLIGIPRIGSGLAAILGSMELPAGLIGSFFILREKVGSGQWIGMALILGGIVVSEIKTKKTEARN